MSLPRHSLFLKRHKVFPVKVSKQFDIFFLIDFAKVTIETNGENNVDLSVVD